MEKLFHTNQLLIASNFFESRAATIGAPPEAYLEWADTSPVPLSTVAQELGVLPRSAEEAEAARELATLGAEQGDRVGTPLFFRIRRRIRVNQIERKSAEEQLADEARTGPFAFSRRLSDVARFQFGGKLLG